MNEVICGDTLSTLKTLPNEFVDCIVTSPPYYGLRDYRIEGQIGLEPTLVEYLDKMFAITSECKRILKKTGTMFWNHGDSYGRGTQTNTKWQKEGKNLIVGYEKSLLLQAHRLIIRMIDEQQWILRNTLIWHKPNCMPSSVKDRFTVDYEPVFFLTKSKKYWFEPLYEKVQEVSIARLNRAVSNQHKWIDGADGQTRHTMNQPRPNRNTKIPAKIAEKMGSPRERYKRYEKSNAPHEFDGGDHMVSPFNPELGRNKRCVWKIPTHPYSEAHFATFPEKLIIPMIRAGCPEFICKKCGKAREKIADISYVPAGGRGKNEKYIDGKIEKYAFSFQKMRLGRARKIESNWRYTDCGCNAGWEGGIILDPFMGSGTTALVARNLRRRYMGIELNPEYIKLANKRLAQQTLL